MAFELIQTKESGTDLSHAYHSLDYVYVFNGQNIRAKVALMSHWARNENEISFKAGDILGTIANNLNSEYSFEHFSIVMNSNEYIFGIHNKTTNSGLQVLNP